eukprot:GHVS01084666.1.p1 GENE.GHVS01084666.1~~GHVS01084666.1.p1  ORF type:complete len:330 (+),score=17.89 GHVS01084666.1:640-1629(+)
MSDRRGGRPLDALSADQLQQSESYPHDWWWLLVLGVVAFVAGLLGFLFAAGLVVICKRTFFPGNASDANSREGAIYDSANHRTSCIEPSRETGWFGRSTVAIGKNDTIGKLVQALPVNSTRGVSPDISVVGAQFGVPISQEPALLRNSVGATLPPISYAVESSVIGTRVDSRVISPSSDYNRNSGKVSAALDIESATSTVPSQESSSPQSSFGSPTKTRIASPSASYSDISGTSPMGEALSSPILNMGKHFNSGKGTKPPKGMINDNPKPLLAEADWDLAGRDSGRGIAFRSSLLSRLSPYQKFDDECERTAYIDGASDTFGQVAKETE